MNKQEAVKMTLEAIGKTDMAFDYALPQDWLDKQANMLGRIMLLTAGDTDTIDTCKSQAYDRILGQTVWAYPQGSIFGQPLPITEDGRKIAQLLKW